MTPLNTKGLKLTFAALNNEKRIKIIELCSKQSLTITELSKSLKLNYSITVKYVSMLEKAKLIKRIRNTDKTVSVIPLIQLNNSGEIKKI